MTSSWNPRNTYTHDLICSPVADPLFDGGFEDTMSILLCAADIAESMVCHPIAWEA